MSARIPRLLLGAAALATAALALHAQTTVEPTGLCGCETDSLFEQPDPPPQVPPCVQSFGVEIWGTIEGRCRDLPDCDVSPRKCTFSTIVSAQSVDGDPCTWSVTSGGVIFPVNEDGDVYAQLTTAQWCGESTVIHFKADGVDLGSISLLCQNCDGATF